MPQTALQAYADMDFRHITQDEFRRHWRRGKLTQVWLGGANAIAIDRDIPGYFTRAASKAHKELTAAKLDFEKSVAYCREHGLTSKEFQAFLDSTLHPADYAYYFMHKDNQRHTSKGRPNNHFALNGSATRYYV